MDLRSPAEVRTREPSRKVRSTRMLRWGVRFALLAGVVASLFANMLHANMRDGRSFAETSFVAHGIAAWSPAAFFVVVEILSRMPAGRSFASFVRYTGTAVVGAVAAWVSYWHMVAVADHYGESSPHLLPLSVDGLIVVASMCLVELTRGDANADAEPAPWRAKFDAWRTRRQAHAAAKPAEASAPATEPVKTEVAEPPAPRPAVPAKPEPKRSDRKPAGKRQGVDRDGIADRVIAGQITYEQAMVEGGVGSKRAVEMWVARRKEARVAAPSPAPAPPVVTALTRVNGFDHSNGEHAGVN